MRTKTSCHLSQDGIDATLFFMKENNKTSRLYIRLTNGENNKLRELAKDYPNLFWMLVGISRVRDIFEY